MMPFGSLSLTFMCSFCGGYLEDREKNKVRIDLFGAVKYAWCPICYADMSDCMNDPVFKNKWSRHMKVRIREALIGDGVTDKYWIAMETKSLLKDMRYKGFLETDGVVCIGLT